MVKCTQESSTDTTISYNITVATPPYNYPFFHIKRSDNEDILNDPIILDSTITHSFTNLDHENYKIRIGTTYNHNISGKCLQGLITTSTFNINPLKTCDKYSVMWTSGYQYMQRPILFSNNKELTDDTHKTQSNDELVNIDGKFYILSKDTIENKYNLIPNESLSGFESNVNSMNTFHSSTNSSHNSNSCSSSHNSSHNSNSCSSSHNSSHNDTSCNSSSSNTNSITPTAKFNLGISDMFGKKIAYINNNELSELSDDLDLKLSAQDFQDEIFMILVNDKFNERIIIYKEKYEIHTRMNKVWNTSRKINKKYNELVDIHIDDSGVSFKLNNEFPHRNRYVLEMVVYNTTEQIGIFNNINGEIRTNLFNKYEESHKSDIFVYTNTSVVIDKDLFCTCTDNDFKTCKYHYSSIQDLHENYWVINKYYIFSDTFKQLFKLF